VVSLSTAGFVPRIRELARTVDHAVNKLFLSLHATTNAVRSQLVPLNKKYPLESVLSAAREYAECTKSKVTATYLLFAEINDSDDDLARLSILLDPDHFLIQLSEWNPVSLRRYTFQPSPRLDFFRERLTQEGFTTFIQRSKGQEIEGGCGQLRSRKQALVEQPITRAGTTRVPTRFVP
jgi:23S rRNA (adenine2503-C2)-methyltransferase